MEEITESSKKGESDKTTEIETEDKSNE